MYRQMYIEWMTKRYSIAEARASLPSVIDQAEAGTDIELTRRGKAVAVVVSRQRYDRLLDERPTFVESYRSFLERFDLEVVGLDVGEFDGIRERSQGRGVDL